MMFDMFQYLSHERAKTNSDIFALQWMPLPLPLPPPPPLLMIVSKGCLHVRTPVRVGTNSRTISCASDFSHKIRIGAYLKLDMILISRETNIYLLIAPMHQIGQNLIFWETLFFPSYFGKCNIYLSLGLKCTASIVRRFVLEIVYTCRRSLPNRLLRTFWSKAKWHFHSAAAAH
jgi:hypothetical protein